MEIYVVRNGDTLYTISKKFNIKTEQITSVNELGMHPYLVVGQALIIPTTRKRLKIQKYDIEINSSITTSVSDCKQTVNNIEHSLTYTSSPNYIINEDFEINKTDENTSQIENCGISTLMNITSNTSFDLYGKMNAKQKQYLTDNILKTIKENNYYGVQIDKKLFEKENSKSVAEFINNLKDNLHVPVFASIDQNSINSNTLPLLRNKVNYINLQVQNCSCNDKAYTPAPFNIINKLIRNIVKAIPSNKIMLEIPVCGYDWELPFKLGESVVKKISPQHAYFTAARNASKIQYDKTAHAPYFYYKDLEDKQHVVWFEDVRSIYLKLEIVHHYRLAGITLLSVENPFPQLWHILNEFYNARKIVNFR